MFRFLDVHGQWQSLTVPKSALAFTWCQVPILYHLRGAVRLALTISRQDGSVQALPQLSLPTDLSTHLFRRTGLIRLITLDLTQESLLPIEV